MKWGWSSAGIHQASAGIHRASAEIHRASAGIHRASAGIHRTSAVIGLDVSSDQLRLAGQQWPVVVQAGVAWMPLPDAFASRVVSVVTLTDFGDVGPSFREVERILIPGGRLVVITTPQNRKEALRPFLESLGGGIRKYYVALSEGTVTGFRISWNP